MTDETPDASPAGQPVPGDEASSLPLAQHHPLDPGDPAKVGAFWLTSRLAETPAGVVYGANEDGGEPVMLVLLSEGAAADHAARERFAGEVNAMHIDTVVARGGHGQDDGRMGVRFRSESDDPHLSTLAPLAPWAALAFDGTVKAVFEAVRVLRAVDLLVTPPLSEPAGPDYRLHWINDAAPGVSRTWALAWPGRRDRAGWVSILVSWLLMILLAALGLLLAILVFQNAPLVSPPPPVPTQASGEGSGEPTSGPPQSGEPTSGQPSSGEPTSADPDSGEPSESGGSPSPGDEPPTRLGTPTMTDPSGDASGPGDPTPNRRL
ncbi:hypothetical protein [Tessaracoccus caeni]|uniref:hypothetical protein n=1 Tax=Tessaracoccus caeni TaxID=3031239 RepID=UPI0023DA60E1|nr:hypothetical protein [Tessaracoccus caeni]MDF1490197.1 hypothetical protein [Tessaracoccus caeni]